MPDEHDDLYERIERSVDAVLRKAHRLSLELETPSLPSLDRIATHADRTPPSDVRCWMIDVDRLVASTGRWDEGGWFVHPAAPDVVRGILVFGTKYVTLADRHGISRHMVATILRGAVMSIGLQMAAAGMTYDHKEMAA